MHAGVPVALDRIDVLHFLPLLFVFHLTLHVLDLVLLLVLLLLRLVLGLPCHTLSRRRRLLCLHRGRRFAVLDLLVHPIS